jgi:hypothetical protein
MLVIPSRAEQSLGRVVNAVPVLPDGWQVDVRVYGRDFGLAPELNPNVDFVPMPDGLDGVGSILQRGLQDAIRDEADAVVKLDGDGQCDPSRLTEFVRRFSSGDDFVLASRYLKTPSVPPPLDRQILSVTFTALVNRVTGWSLTDAPSGYFGLSIRAARRLLPKLQTQGYGIGLEILLRHAARGGRVQEIAYEANYTHGNPKFDVLYSADQLVTRCQRAAVYLEVVTATMADLQASKAQARRETTDSFASVV